MFDSAVTFVHKLLRDTLFDGAIAVDATMGNGLDTALMASLVGPTGTVYSFDVQPAALEATILRTDGLPAKILLMLRGHQHMSTYISPDHHGRVSAVTFNLGYLPGGNHGLTTEVTTTVIALEQARLILAPKGIITIVCYKHEEGTRELEAVRSLISQWPQSDYTCTETIFINQVGNPPVVFVVVAR